MQRVALIEVAAWFVAATLAYVAAFGIDVVVHFSCGGDVPGFGSSGTEGLDVTCRDRWAPLGVAPFGVLGGAVLIRLRGLLHPGRCGSARSERRADPVNRSGVVTGRRASRDADR